MYVLISKCDIISIMGSYMLADESVVSSVTSMSVANELLKFISTIKIKMKQLAVTLTAENFYLGNFVKLLLFVHM